MKKARLFISALFLLLTASLYAQNIKVAGVVRDASTGEGVPFASVVVKGTMNGVASDADGNYSINAPADGILEFSAIGYKPQDVQVSGNASINVSLAPDQELLEETIVVAYGTATKSSFTGSASMVNSVCSSPSQPAGMPS